MQPTSEPLYVKIPRTNHIWTLEEAITTARGLEALLVPLGYHCALGGSVLHKGSSEKDLDIFIYPHDVAKQMPAEAIMSALAQGGAGGSSEEREGLSYGMCNEEYEERDAKTVWWSYGSHNRRIDFFFLT